MGGKWGEGEAAGSSSGGASAKAPAGPTSFN